jgi:zinc finger SWIM domain-containing protein 3
LITNIFWADAKMVADYKSYGYVVGFDTTYRKLNDGRPLGLLVGVNNHKKTTVFGAALLYDETTESFIWLFRKFLKVMSGKKPQTILTDEHF